jgi:Epoxide hydrolase N terminus
LIQWNTFHHQVDGASQTGAGPTDEETKMSRAGSAFIEGGLGNDNSEIGFDCRYTRRRILAVSAAATGISAVPAGAGEATESSQIRPFHYTASERDLSDLGKRIAATRWPDREQVSDTTQGVQVGTMQQQADYWLHHHDWRKVEARINGYPNFLTKIDGLDIHFIHVKSKH